ncbi:discoidin domain-containing protein [Allonocardiopsis opalescens]|uniref:F5/8 type C domain-containing protein n=1 Tax=Allonocardiopsis opalescens TaxID=1144618 RepID=A0A2T0PX68_9ACTN|nr:discoidin domain-containing protein [Allonocardiopsis opalescens]PRX96134.1 F5/8 type C domain-containing protein [Allonocardiopsis opalescens]
MPSPNRSRPSPRRARRLFALVTALAVSAPLTAAAAEDAPAPEPPPVIEPVLAGEIDISAAGGGARMLFGDVSGDGRLDIVMMQPAYSEDDRYIGAQVQALTAYELTGEPLWQVGTPDPRVTNNGSDIPAQIYDIDGDGDNEVLAVVEDRFTVFDGATGEFVRDFALPHPEAHDAIAIANFRGLERPSDILLKDRYNQVWALDSYGEVLWTHRGNPGHYPWPYDFDDDGDQELMAGYEFLESDGTLRWTADMADHADTMWMGDVDGDGAPDITLGGAETVVHDSSGREIWRNNETVESQNIILGDFRTDLDGLEALGLDRIDRTENGYDGLFLIDSQGSMIFQEERETRGCWGSIPDKIHNWDGRHSDLIMVWNRGCGEATTISDGHGNVVTTFPVDGRLMHADLCGDDREEVVDYVMGDTAYIYTNGGCDLDSHITGEPQPQLKQRYNFTRYSAGEQPVDHAAGHPARSSSGRGADRALDGSAASGWRPSALDHRPWWRVDLERQREITQLELELPGATGPAWARPGYRVEVSADGRDWTQIASGELARRPRTAHHDVVGLGRHVRVGFTGHWPFTARSAGLDEVRILGNR